MATSQNIVDIVMRNTIKMAWTVVPQNMNNREIFEVGASDVEEGFSESERRMDNKVDSNDRQRRVNFSPLEVMFRAYLNRRRGSEAEGDDRTINGAMSKLPFCPVSLESS